MQSQGKVLGIPYDFRLPTLSRVKEKLWNEDDPRIFTPHLFGVGWSINYAALKKRSKVGFVLALAATAVVCLNIVRSTLRLLKRNGRNS